jgi:hypothetical protein
MLKNPRFHHSGHLLDKFLEWASLGTLLEQVRHLGDPSALVVTHPSLSRRDHICCR